MGLKRPDMVLIDLDGTLIDTAVDLAYCADAMMRELGRDPPGEAQVRLWVGNGIRRLVERCLTGDLDAAADPDQLEDAVERFQTLYARHFADRSKPYPGVREGLDQLQSDGYPLACVTNKPTAYSKPLLEAVGLMGYFQTLICGDTLPRKKPDPAPLLHAARLLQTDPEASLMVGDSINDVTAARAAGFQVACVRYGYNHGQDISEAAPDAVLESLAELPERLRQASSPQ